MRTFKEKVNINNYPPKEDHSGAKWERGWKRQRVKKEGYLGNYCAMGCGGESGSGEGNKSRSLQHLPVQTLM